MWQCVLNWRGGNGRACQSRHCPRNARVQCVSSGRCRTLVYISLSHYKCEGHSSVDDVYGWVVSYHICTVILVVMAIVVKASSYIVQYPQDRSKRFTLYFPDRPVHSEPISISLGSIQPYATINARRLLVHIVTTVYSQVFIQLSELSQSNVEWKNLPKVLTPQHRIRTRVLVVKSPKLYPWATALYYSSRRATQ